jgi:hypothetical protein
MTESKHRHVWHATLYDGHWVEWELPYLAGFFDGEGSINLGHTLRLSVGQISRVPLEQLQSRFGGSMRVQQPGRNNRRPWHAWLVTGPRAEVALLAMLPWLGVKQWEARIALRWYALLGPVGNRPITPDIRRQRDALDQELRTRSGLQVTEPLPDPTAAVPLELSL